MTDQDDRWEQALASLSPEEREFGQPKAAALLELAELLKDVMRAYFSTEAVPARLAVQ